MLDISHEKRTSAIKGSAEFDLKGRRVIPGFIDGHTHLTGGGGESGFKSRIAPVPLGQFTTAGVTSVVGVLGTDDCARDTRSLLAQVYALREQGLGAWCHTGGYHLPPTTLTGCVRDDIVFLEPVIGVGELALSDHRSSHPTLNELLRVASDARVAGMIAGKAGIVHLHLGDGTGGLELVRDALQKSELPARVFNPTHVNRRKALFEEAIALARLGSSVDITAFPVEEGEDAWAADTALLRFLDSGAPPDRVTISTDSGGCLPVFDQQGRVSHFDVGQPSSLIETLQSLLTDGAPLERVLPAFTSNVADALCLLDRGRVHPNFAADLIVLDDAHGISDVMIAGKWHVQSGKQRIFDPFEQQQS